MWFLRSLTPVALVFAVSAASLQAADDVPDGSPKELIKYIQKLQSAEPQGSTRTERQESLRKNLAKIVSAADKVLAGKPDDESATTAAETEFEALSALTRLGDEAAGEKLEKLSKSLKKDKRPLIAQTAEFFQLTQEKERLDESSDEELREFARKYEKFVLQARQFVSHSRLREKMVGLAAVSVQILQQVDGALAAAKTAEDLAAAFAQSEDPLIASQASQFSTYAGRLYESKGEKDKAVENYERVAKLLAKSDDEDVRASGEKLLGAVRHLNLLGSHVKIEGTLVNGKKFDWSKYKGKVVLVDFWATWCGPCLKELPNVKQTYEKYHDQGFEVIGISLDDDEQTLKEFLEEEQLPWPILFSSDSKATGWEHPMASYYGISSIPAAILVDRKGKVVSLEARGSELGKMVAELTGADDE